MLAPSHDPARSASLCGLVRASTGCVLSLLAALAPAEAAAGLPPAVAAAVAENGATCGGRVSFDGRFVTRRDVNGDGVPDYLLDYAGWHCSAMPSGFCGSAGCLQQVFVSGPRGRYTEVFDENAVLSFSVVRGRRAMTVRQGGFACGRQANALGCIETRFWNGRTFAGPR